MPATPPLTISARVHHHYRPARLRCPRWLHKLWVWF